ncbi:MAG: hypothetical protein R2710_28535 [Acidimicrobiales bacterium]
MTAYQQPERTHRTPWFVFAAFALVVSLAAGVVSADAAGLGGITSRTLSASRQIKAAQAPTVIAWDNFNAPNNTNLNGRTTTGGGKTWIARRGTWTIQGNRADTNSGDVALVLDAGTPYAAVEATTFRGGTTFDIGVVTNMNSAGTQFLTAELLSTNSGELQVWKYDGGWTLLANVTNLYSGAATGWPASTTVRMSSSTGGVMTVTIGGAVVSTFTLSAADRTTFQNATHQFFGLYSYFDGVSVWDDVHVDSA